jgi:hypothetical protein
MDVRLDAHILLVRVEVLVLCCFARWLRNRSLSKSTPITTPTPSVDSKGNCELYTLSLISYSYHCVLVLQKVLEELSLQIGRMLVLPLATMN